MSQFQKPLPKEIADFIASSDPKACAWYSPTTRRFYQGRSGDVRQAQMLLPTDITTIQAKVVLEEVMGLARPDYALRYACRVIGMPQLVMSIDVATKYSAHEKVDPLVEADVKAQTYTRVDFSLWKNVVHVVIADETRKTAAHDVFRLNTGDAGGALAASENSQIATVIEGVDATGTAGQDWGDSTKNPYDDIIGRMSAIRSAGYRPDFIVADPLVWGDFFSNDKVKFAVAAGGQVQFPNANTFPVPGLPGITGISDYSLTDTIAIVGSVRNAGVVFGDGPIESAMYRNEPAGYDAFIIRQWLEPKAVVSGAIKKLTGIHA